MGWKTDYQQVGAGSFDAWFDTHVSPDFRVVEQYCNRAIAVSGSPPPDHVPLLLVLNRGERGRFLGKALRDDQAVMMCPGSEATLLTPEHLKLITISIGRKRLAQACQNLLGVELDPLVKKTRALSLSETIYQELIGLARKSIYAPGQSEGSGIARAEHEQRLMEVFLSQLANSGDARSESLDRSARANYVLRARDYIEAHLDGPLGLETLAEVTGVSPRTLEYAFREKFDITLVRYIKVRRLHAARRALASADAEYFTVAGIARQFGFAHAGYFSRDYRQLVGELPSETLEKLD